MTQIMTIDAAKTLVNTANKAINEFRSDLFAQREADFFANGGCKTCNGQGDVCVWGTLDSMSGGYDEFGKCPDCDGKAQPWVGVNRRRKSQHPKVAASKIPPLAVTSEEITKLDDLEENLKIAQDMLNTAESAWEIIKGSRVKVVRGRKTPKGTEGIVFWMGEGRS